ncbi:MAG: hypothetical protein HY652_04710 [Acidobacteria bacterium]|nr:hypothetical protein [Acidobacteriota bacterium]
MNPTLEKELREQLDRLAPEKQRQVLEFARALGGTSLRGVPGESLSRFGGTIEAADLVVITEAIEEACEQVRLDEW